MSDKPKYTQHQEKLEILYFLEKISTETETDQIWRAVSGLELMSYIEFIEYLEMLNQSKMISILDDDGNHYYTITEKGKNALREFRLDIGKSVRDRIDEYVNNNKKSLISERDFSAEVIREADDRYIAYCRMYFEHRVVFEIKMLYSTWDEARRAAHFWSRDGASIYASVFDMLS